MTDVCERWMWESPGEIIERLVARSERLRLRVDPVSLVVVTRRTPRDRYYTQARRLRIRKLMKGTR